MGFILKTIYQARYSALIESLVLARKELNITQLDIAKILGKPQSYVAKIEGKDRKLDVVEFVELCEAINQNPSELIKILQNNS